VRKDPGLEVELMDGNKGEFSVAVDGRQIKGKDWDNLRPIEDLVGEIGRGEVVSGA